MKYSFAALGAAVAIASAVGVSSASADGYSRPRAAYAPPAYTSWSGFYIGGHVGAAWSDADWADVNLTGEPVSNSSSGFIGGGQIGYNQQYGNIVLGVEASLSGTTLSDDSRSVVNPAVTYSTDVNTIVTVTGRLGVAVDQWLLYGKAGWAGAQVDVSGRNPPFPDSFSFDDWRNGWTVGAGIEYKLARNISLGLEYSYIDLGSDSFSGRTAAGLPVTVSDHDLQIQSVTARLNFQFYRDRDDYRPLK